MRNLKSTITVLFSICLIWAQGVVALGGDSHGRHAKSARCCCQSRSCCPASTPSSPTPPGVAASTAQTVSQEEFALERTELPPTRQPSFSPKQSKTVFPSLPPRPQAVPLFDQFCQHLI